MNEKSWYLISSSNKLVTMVMESVGTSETRLYFYEYITQYPIKLPSLN
jgi:hypothetical protein